MLQEERKVEYEVAEDDQTVREAILIAVLALFNRNGWMIVDVTRLHIIWSILVEKLESEGVYSTWFSPDVIHGRYRLLDDTLFQLKASRFIFPHPHSRREEVVFGLLGHEIAKERERNLKIHEAVERIFPEILKLYRS